jgi:hypothetical protein
MRQRSRFWRITVLGAAAVGLGFSIPMGALADTVVNVTPANMNGWQFNSRDATGVAAPNVGSAGQMVAGPAMPPLGIGSAKLTAGDGTAGGDGSEELSTNNFNGTPLSSLTSLSYWTYDVQNNGQQFPYLSIAVSNTGDPNCPSDKLFFEPPYQQPSSGNPSLPDQGMPVMNTWQGWNALEGGWWTNCGLGGSGGTNVVPLSTIEAAYPNAVIAQDPYGLGGIGLNVGFGNSTDQFNGSVDDLTLGVNGVNTTYNFDPNTAPPTNPDQCKKGGWMQFGTFKNQGQCVSYTEHLKQ